MARAVVAALVLCAAVLVAAAHAGRVIEYQALEAGMEAAAAALALAPVPAAASPEASAADDVADADAGGVRTLGVLEDVQQRAAGLIGDAMWLALQWAKQAVSGGGERRMAS